MKINDQADDNPSVIQEPEPVSQPTEPTIMNTNPAVSEPSIPSRSQSDGSRDSEGESEVGEESWPILYLDVNIGGNTIERLVINDGDDPKVKAREFCEYYGLNERKEGKLIKVIEQQMAGLLTRIVEEENSQHDSSTFM